MGTPFQPVIKTFLHLTDLRINPHSLRITKKDYLIPDIITSIPIKKRVRCSTASVIGARTRLPRLHFLAALFLRVEILGTVQQSMDKEAMLRSFRKEFPHVSAQVSRRYFDRMASYLSEYNKGRLYKDQRMPPLYSFNWNKSGYIRHNRLQSQLLSFQFCKRLLSKSKFADPRFFTEHERRTVEELGWHVPLPAEVARIEAEIKKPLYDSIEFPPGYGKNYDPL